MTDWVDILKEQAATGERMAHEVPAMLDNPDISEAQVRALFVELEKQADFVEKLRMVLEVQADHIQKCGGIKNVDLELQGEGDVRHGQAEITFKGDCPPQKEKVSMVRENGEWKLSVT